MKYVFATRINGTEETGIIDVTRNPPVLLCLCDKEQSILLLQALNISSKQVVTSSANYDVDKVQKVAADIVKEVLRAKTLFPNNFVNQHEAYAVLLEEVDELWDEIKKNQRNYDLDAQRKEATQAAAMLVRLLVELL